jgi:hypothetical protein
MKPFFSDVDIKAINYMHIYKKDTDVSHSIIKGVETTAYSLLSPHTVFEARKVENDTDYGMIRLI